MFPIKFGVKSNPVKSAGNLVVIFDKHFTICSHISAVCSSCFYHMRDLWRIRHHLDLDSANLLAPVSSRLDYCNSILYGIADIDLTRLQRVQNRLVHLMTNSPPFTRSLPLLRSLHQLPVRYRILFKTNLLTHKTLREKEPVYLHLTWPSPIDTTTPNGLLLLRNCFLDFAVEHWLGCFSTKPGFVGDIGAIEIWLIDRLIDWLIEKEVLSRSIHFFTGCRPDPEHPHQRLPSTICSMAVWHPSKVQASLWYLARGKWSGEEASVHL